MGHEQRLAKFHQRKLAGRHGPSSLSFAGGTSRPDARRKLIIQEANAIGTSGDVAFAIHHTTLCQIRKHRPLDSFPYKPALFQHPFRRCVFRMAPGIETLQFQRSDKGCDRSHRLSCIAFSPRVFRQQIARGGDFRRFKINARAAQKFAAFRFDEIRPSRPALRAD